MSKMLLVHPDAPYIPMSKLGLVNLEPLAIEYLAGGLRDDVDVLLLDLRIAGPGLEECIVAYEPDIVGFSCSSFHVQEVLHLARRVRRVDSGITTMVGGYHVNTRSLDLHTADIDFCCLGGGIDAIREVLSRRGRGAGRPSETQDIKARLSLDYDIAYPLRSRLNLTYDSYVLGTRGRTGLIQTSSGCPYTCSYCDVIVFNGGKYLTRGVDAVIADILDISADKVMFSDDESLINERTMSRLASEVRQCRSGKRFFLSSRAATIARNSRLVEEWREAGLRGVFLGFDAITQDDLDSFHKGSTLSDILEAIAILHGLDIEIFGNFIILQRFLPRDFDALANFVIEHEIESPSLTILTPIPETRLWCESHGQPVPFSSLDLSHSVLPTFLPEMEFMRQVASLRERLLGSAALAQTVSQLDP